LIQRFRRLLDDARLTRTIWRHGQTSGFLPMDKMGGVAILWCVLTLLAMFGGAVFAERDPISTSLVKILGASTLLFIHGASLAASITDKSQFFGQLIGTGWLPYILSCFDIFMMVLGAPLCFGTILGVTLGLYRTRDRFST
jgi:hypothetical protein